MQWTELDSVMLWMPLEHFKLNESWGDYKKMHPLIILIIEKFRGFLPHGCWIKIHCGYKQGGHTKNSFHYTGRAVDFHIVGCSFMESERHLIKFLKRPIYPNGNEICLIDYVGLGIYPEWKDPGFHLDVRGKRATWSKFNSGYMSYEIGMEKARELSL